MFIQPLNPNKSLNGHTGWVQVRFNDLCPSRFVSLSYLERRHCYSFTNYSEAHFINRKLGWSSNWLYIQSGTFISFHADVSSKRIGQLFSLFPVQFIFSSKNKLENVRHLNNKKENLYTSFRSLIPRSQYLKGFIYSIVQNHVSAFPPYFLNQSPFTAETAKSFCKLDRKEFQS